MLHFCTHIEGNKDGWDGAGEANPPAKEEHTETGYDGKDKAMIPRSIVALMHNLGMDHLRLGLYNHHIARLLLLWYNWERSIPCKSAHMHTVADAIHNSLFSLICGQ